MATNNPDDNNRPLEPPSSLHTKLQAIHFTITTESYNTDTRANETTNKEVYLPDEAIAQILQAVQSEYPLLRLDTKTGDIITVNAETYKMNGDGTISKILHMTGQEFYDRFKAELTKNMTDYSNYSDAAMEAARRAAGVSDE